jgi:hypothetical protein
MHAELESTWNEAVVAEFVVGVLFRYFPSEAEQNNNYIITIGVWAEIWIETFWIRDRTATNWTVTLDFWSVEM